MQRWDRRLARLCATLLCFMAIGHGIAFIGMSQSLGATALDRLHAEAIRDVWLTISAMLAGFGLLLLRATWGNARPDWGQPISKSPNSCQLWPSKLASCIWRIGLKLVGDVTGFGGNPDQADGDGVLSPAHGAGFRKVQAAGIGIVIIRGDFHLAG